MEREISNTVAEIISQPHNSYMFRKLTHKKELYQNIGEYGVKLNDVSPVFLRSSLDCDEVAIEGSVTAFILLFKASAWVSFNCHKFLYLLYSE